MQNVTTMPKLSPKTILCVGRNYVEHAKELNNPVNLGKPFFFLKPPSSIICEGQPIRIPPEADVHYEVELAMVLGAKAHRVKSDEDARRCVAGYLVCIDLTARNWQNDAKAKGLPWTLAKGCDTFLPCGEMVNAETLPDPNDVTLTLRLNGNLKQQESTKMMIHNTWSLIKYASAFMTLEPGDMILTGTPKGVGPIKVGDKLSIEGVGRRATFSVEQWM